LKNHLGNGRFRFIDGLRGLAALSVMFHHLYYYSDLHKPLTEMLPASAPYLLTSAACGVQVFFVISGFVIAYSLRDLVIRPASAANFILRRQIRLDPPYWICVAIAVLNVWLATLKHPSYANKLPGPGDVLANLFYLHALLGRMYILDVSWTLCLEVQFYLAFILLLALVQRLAARLPGWDAVVRLAVLGLPAALSAALMAKSYIQHPAVDAAKNPFFIYTWYLFAMGVLVCWALGGQIPAAAFWAFDLIVLAIGLALGHNPVIVGAATGGAVYLVGRAGHLSDWLAWPVIQYFGAISYSLYLVHLDVLTRVLKLGISITGMEKLPAVMWIFVAAAASVGVAHLMHTFVEKPAMRLAGRLKPRKQRAGDGASGGLAGGAGTATRTSFGDSADSAGAALAAGASAAGAKLAGVNPVAGPELIAANH
jgi:hypothetical protein